MSLDHSKLENKKLNPDGSFQCGCPACMAEGSDKSKNHLRVYPDGKYNCALHPGDILHNGKTFQLVGVQDEQPGLKKSASPRRVADYLYTDQNGNPLFFVARVEPGRNGKKKDFFQYHKDANGKEVNNMQGVKRVLYHLPDVIAANAQGKLIVTCEGEKDVDAVRRFGLCATCNAGGAGKWESQYTEALTGADVVMILDKDEPGRMHGKIVAPKLHGTAKSLKLIELPDRDGRKVKDAYDWIQAGGTLDELKAIIEQAPVYKLPEARTSKTSKRLDDKPIYILPGGDVPITESAKNLFEILAPSKELFLRGGCVMELRGQDDGQLYLSPIEPEAFRSRIEKYASIHRYIEHKSEPVLKSTSCSLEAAKALLATLEREILPRINGLSNSPVITEDAAGVKILERGYHSERGGLLVTHGQALATIPTKEAVCSIKSLLSDFNFTAPGDLSRALAMFTTPALHTGGFINGHIPIVAAEADQSQAGKDYLMKISGAVHNEHHYMVANREGGVGSIDESLSAALVAGRRFILFDNIRGKMASQFLEAMLTAGGLIGARVPRMAEVLVDTRFFNVFMTSNGVETTRDLANRSSVIRIKKQPRGYVFRQYPEGSLLEHVKAKQAYYLSCVFSVIREWIAKGKPRTKEYRHDFREWAQILDYIVQEIYHEAPLLDGHDCALERVSNPAMTWLRKITLAIAEDGSLDTPMQAAQIADLCEQQGIEIPGLKDISVEDKRNKQVGMILARLYRDAADGILEIDSFTVERQERQVSRNDGNGNFSQKTYVFHNTTATTVSTPTTQEKGPFPMSIPPLTVVTVVTVAEPELALFPADNDATTKAAVDDISEHFKQ